MSSSSRAAIIIIRWTVAIVHWAITDYLKLFLCQIYILIWLEFNDLLRWIEHNLRVLAEECFITDVLLD